MDRVREWQPGDVAMIPGCGPRVMTERGWATAQGNFVKQGQFQNARPLVVLDPQSADDRDALAKALVEAMHRAGDERSAAIGVHPATIGMALDSLANPEPPIEEPTGLGAVVEDESQVEYVHLGSGLWAYGTTDGPSQGFCFADIKATRVLSEGVPAEADR